MYETSACLPTCCTMYMQDPHATMDDGSCKRVGCGDPLANVSARACIGVDPALRLPSANACLPAVIPPSAGSEPELPSPPAPETPASSDLANRAAAQLLRYARAWLLARSYGYGSLPEAWSDYESMTDAWSSEPGLYVLRDSLLVLRASYRLTAVT